MPETHQEIKTRLDSLIPIFREKNLLREGFDHWEVAAESENDSCSYYSWSLRPKTNTYIIATYMKDKCFDLSEFKFIVKVWGENGGHYLQEEDLPAALLLDFPDCFFETIIDNLNEYINQSRIFGL